MKNKINFKYIVLLVFFCLSFNSIAYGELRESVEVGLSAYSGKTSFKLENNNINISMYNNGSINKIGELYSNIGFEFKNDDSYYIRTDYFYNDFSTALGQANLLKETVKDTVIGIENDGLLIYFGPFNSYEEANEFLMTGHGKSITEPDNKIKLMVNGENKIVYRKDLGLLFSSNEFVKLGYKEYRGYIKAIRNGSTISAVNVVDIEDYLRSVVPSEMPSAWHIEALKAQVVAARSYTHTRRGIHKESGYELCDSIHCQVYGGVSNEKESTNKAIDETKGLGIYYENEIINATFFSSSGGMTDDSENVWTNTLPYLRGVVDTYDISGKIWSRSFTLNDIDELLIVSNTNIGNAKAMEITKTGRTGRINEMIIHGTNGKKVLEKEEVRTFFSGSKGGSLESRNFTFGDTPIVSGNNSSSGVPTDIFIENSYEKKLGNKDNLYTINGNGNISKLNGNLSIISKDGISSGNKSSTVQNNQSIYATGNIVINGKGWGHGVGLSQHGAKGMAEAGYKFDEILKHYYTGVEIR